MIGDKIRQLRRERNLTQDEFALLFNVTKGAVGMWETNKRKPDFDTINKIAEYFNVSVDFLYGNKKLFATILPQGGKAERLELTQEDIETIKKLTELFKKK